MVIGVVERQQFTTIERPHKVIKDRTVLEKIVTKDSRVTVKVINAITIENITSFVKSKVKTGSYLYTDELAAYKHLVHLYKHESVNHKSNEYRKGDAYTNTIEGFWSLLKRQIDGIHHSVSAKHLQRYSNEAAYRYNQKSLKQDAKFQNAISRCNGRLKYKQLVK